MYKIDTNPIQTLVKQHNGMATLSTLVLLLTLGIMVCAFCTRVAVFQAKVLQNYQGYQDAFYSAENALNTVIQQIRKSELVKSPNIQTGVTNDVLLVPENVAWKDKNSVIWQVQSRKNTVDQRGYAEVISSVHQMPLIYFLPEVNLINADINLLSTIFASKKAPWVELIADADLYGANCENVSELDGGFIIIVGDCYIRGAIELGTINSPVVLLVLNGDLGLANQVHVIGAVLHFAEPTAGINLDYRLVLEDTATIRGVVISQFSPPLESMNNISYDSSVRKGILQSKTLSRLRFINGSWRDF